MRWIKKTNDKTMDKTFIDLAKRMREAQKEYFRTRSSASLNESKRLEREFDKALERFNTPLLFA